LRPKKVILLALADPLQLSELALIFDVHGYRVLRAETSDEAVRLFAVNSVVDLVLADYRMPDRTAVELVQKLKAITPWVPIILLGDVKTATEFPTDGMVDKHTTSTFELIERVRIMRTTSAFELIERVRIMSARKRGPRKGTGVRTRAILATV
jgi:CheY-like chemotaxis protein